MRVLLGALKSKGGAKIRNCQSPLYKICQVRIVDKFKNNRHSVAIRLSNSFLGISSLLPFLVFRGIVHSLSSGKVEMFSFVQRAMLSRLT